MLHPEAISFSSSTQTTINWFFSILKEEESGFP
jgi:hypothetical protein